jgi:hypothetical protein
MRKFALAALPLLVVCPATPVMAACSVPNVITNGQVADATKVMDNFNTVAACADEAVKPAGAPVAGQIAIFASPSTVTSGNLTGEVVTTGGTATSLAPTGVTPGSYSSANIVVDAKGRITSASDGSGATANRYTHIRLYTAAAATTFNVNSTTYLRVIPLSFATDLLYFPWTQYQIAISGASNQAGQTVTVELHSVGGGDPRANSTGNDLVVSNAGNLYRSPWISRTDARTGPQEYTLFIKGSNTTVDLSATFIDILLKI